MDKLRNAELIINSIMEYSRDFITLKDNNFRYISCNKALLKFLNLPDISGIKDKTANEFLEPNYAKILEAHLKETAKTKETKTYTFPISNDKLIRQTSVPLINNNSLIGIISLSSILGVDENNELKNLSSVNKLLDKLPVRIYMKDKNLNCITGSCPLGNEETEDKYVLTSKEPLIKEKTAKSNDGENHWYKVYKAPVLDENKDINGVVTITQNIDAEKEMEIQKETFLETLTHDLKNPLQAQVRSLELLLNGKFGGLNNSQKEILDITIESAKFMNEMLYSMLKTYKYNNGALKISKENFNIENLVIKCIDETSSIISGKNLNLKFDNRLNEDEKIICADEKQLRRVITNLLNNAVKYAFENSVIVVGLKKLTNDFVFSLRNSSPVIPENIKPHIFDKYVSGAVDYKKTGFGLGLYFCRKVIEGHGGTIRLRAEGTDNEFIFKLPCAVEASDSVRQILW